MYVTHFDPGCASACDHFGRKRAKNHVAGAQDHSPRVQGQSGPLPGIIHKAASLSREATHKNPCISTSPERRQYFTTLETLKLLIDMPSFRCCASYAKEEVLVCRS